MAEKRCGRCGAVKKISEFYAKRFAADLLSWDCIECHRADVARRYANRRHGRQPIDLAKALHGPPSGIYGSIDADLDAAHSSEAYRAMMEACELAWERNRR